MLAAAIALVWLAFTLVAALHGLTRAFGDRGRIEELCIAVGFMYLAISGGWVVLWRSGIAVMDFAEHVPLLTAIHFHYAGFVSPILVGFNGRELRAAGTRLWPVYVGAASLVIVGPALVALGIAGVRTIEAPAAAILAAGTAAVALLALAAVLQRVQGVLARVLLAVSSAAAIVAMTLATLYAVANPLGIAGVRQIEAPAAAILASGTAVVALIALATVLTRVRGTVARGLLAVSSAAAFVAMTLATLYAVGNPLEISAIGLEDMARWHGSFNALGYVFCGLLGWNVRRM